MVIRNKYKSSSSGSSAEKRQPVIVVRGTPSCALVNTNLTADELEHANYIGARTGRAYASTSTDRWQHGPSVSLRIHDTTRQALFTPSNTDGIDNVCKLCALRITVVLQDDGKQPLVIADSWKGASPHRQLPNSWRGVTIFFWRSGHHADEVDQHMLDTYVRRAQPKTP